MRDKEVSLGLEAILWRWKIFKVEYGKSSMLPGEGAYLILDTPDGVLNERGAHSQSLIMALMKALTETRKSKKWLLSWCKTWILNDFRFSLDFTELEWHNGLSEKHATRCSRVRSRAEAHFTFFQLLSRTRDKYMSHNKDKYDSFLGLLRHIFRIQHKILWVK